MGCDPAAGARPARNEAEPPSVTAAAGHVHMIADAS